MDGSVTWPEPSEVGVVRGATAFDSTPGFRMQQPVEHVTMIAKIGEVTNRSRMASFENTRTRGKLRVQKSCVDSSAKVVQTAILLSLGRSEPCGFRKF
jgi:hypothetical protein